MNALITLDLAAVRHNLNAVRAKVPGAQILAVIKADAYGHGLIRMARAMDSAEGFAVARLDEALSLRHSGIEQRIVVLQGFVEPSELELMSQYGLEPVVHSDFQVEILEQSGHLDPLQAWMKLDTGMHRLGFLPEEYAEYHHRLGLCSAVRQPVHLMTHLASADERDHPTTTQQLNSFAAQLDGYSGERCIANSAGIMAWTAAHTCWIRPGIMLYGVSPFPGRTGDEEGLHAVMSFRTRLIAIKSLKPGARVGYGGDWVSTRWTRMGIAAVGYGDGYPRHAQSGTPVLVGGYRVPLIGRVSMDMINLDLTDTPEVKVGDEVTLWGAGLPVEEVARYSGTIPYALLCGITQRVKRVEIGASL